MFALKSRNRTKSSRHNVWLSFFDTYRCSTRSVNDGPGQMTMMDRDRRQVFEASIAPICQRSPFEAAHEATCTNGSSGK